MSRPDLNNISNIWCILESMTVLVGELSVEMARRALNGEKAHIIYSDPPWGPANLKYWRHHNGQTGHPVDWPGFLTILSRVVVETLSPGGHVFLEMGCRWIDELSEVMLKTGFPEAHRWNIMYGPKSKPLPNMLWYSGPGTSCNPEGMRGEPLTQHVINSVASPGVLVFDPCCGKGMTARCSVKSGMRFVGCELNPKRAEVTEKWLRSHSK